MVTRWYDIGSVLVAVDDSEQADRALQHAVTEYADSDITAVHVIDIFASGHSIPAGWESVDEVWETREEYATDRAATVLEDARKTAAEQGVQISTTTVRGAAPEEIVAYAESEHVDCIVVGSHGRTGLSRIALGSVAEKVLRRSPCPVTVVGE